MNHAEAAVLIAAALPEVSDGGRMLVQNIGWLESNYGAGWKGAGKDSHNWGAITGTHNGDYFVYGDSRPNPADPNHPIKYETKFRKYPDHVAGIQDLWRLLNSRYRGAADAAEEGRWEDVSQELYDRHYYTGTSTNPATNVERHRGRVMKTHAAIAPLYGIPTDAPSGEDPSPFRPRPRLTRFAVAMALPALSLLMTLARARRRT